MTPSELAATLEIDIDDIAICKACLSFVSFAIDSGDEREIRRWTNRMTPDLWEEGLALPARLAVDRARQRGLPGADEALTELCSRGPRSEIARAIVRRLAADLSARAKGDLLRMGFQRFVPP